MDNTKKYLLLDRVFLSAGVLATAFALLVLSALLLDVVFDALPKLNIDFLTSYPSRKAADSGAYSAIVGTIWMMCVTALLAFPLGLASGIYLEEYAPKNRFTAFIELNINNLAGVPSIIFGLLGLSVFVRFFGFGQSILAGACTLTLLILPVIILTTREALRVIPSSIRHAAYALGATKWQVVSKQVVPAAMGNILTGFILAMSRAIGETAPLVTIGALAYVAFIPESPVQFFPEQPFVKFTLSGIFESFSVLPIQIFNWVSKAQKGFANCAAGGIVVLLGLTLLMNFFAIMLRNRYQKKIKW